MGKQLYDNDKETGMIIIRSPSRPALLGIPIPLKCPVFNILFFIPETERHVTLPNMPTLREAKRLAESYYVAWLKVKDDSQSEYSYFYGAWLANTVDAKPIATYPLADIAGGSSGKEGSHNGRDYGLR